MENNMTQDQLIKALFVLHVQQNGNYKITEFKKNLDLLIKENIGGTRGLNKVDNSWRTELKSRFSGRGRQWIQTSLDSIDLVLERLDAEGYDTTSYRQQIAKQGFAWVRFAGPRIDINGHKAGGFEVRLEGSRVDSPKTLMYIPVEDLDESNITRLQSTPFALGFEKSEVTETKTEEVAETPVVKEVIDNEPSIDEVLLAAEELENEDDIFGDI